MFSISPSINSLLKLKSEVYKKLSFSNPLFRRVCLIFFINYFYEDFSDYLINQENFKGSHMNVNYNFLVKIFSELTDEQKIKLNKNLQEIDTVARTG